MIIELVERPIFLFIKSIAESACDIIRAAITSPNHGRRERKLWLWWIAQRWKRETWTVPALVYHTCGGMAVSMAKLGKTEAFVSRRIAAKSIRSVEARRGPRDWSGGRTKRIKRCPSLFFTDVNRFTTRASLFLGNLSFPREPRESARAPGRRGLKFYFEKFVVRWMISVFDIWKGKVKKSSC